LQVTQITDLHGPVKLQEVSNALLTQIMQQFGYTESIWQDGASTHAEPRQQVVDI
jgi:hypothetical protein